MKQIRHTVTALVLAVAWFAGTSHAQDTSVKIKAHIPFEFNVGDKTFPAGNYSITRPLQNFLALRDDRGRVIATAFTHAEQDSSGSAATKLRFLSSGGQRTLTQVWRADESPVGQELLLRKSRVMTAARPTVDTDPSVGGTKP
jgi:hypothetical protein